MVSTTPFRALIIALLILSPILGAIEGRLQAQLDTEFTFQGYLRQGSNAAPGPVDIKFSLFDSEIAGSQLGLPVEKLSLTLVDGVFATELDFGPVFAGEARWLEIEVRTAGSIGDYEVLTPRQRIHSAPYALFASTSSEANTAATSADAEKLDGLDSTSFLQVGGGAISGNLSVAGRVGIGRLASATLSLDVAGGTRLSGSVSQGTSVASGPNSSAFGQSSQAVGFNSFAAGQLSVASGNNAIAVGTSAEATNTASSAFGTNTTASGQNSTAGGNNTSATGADSVAFGTATMASGEAAFAAGTNTTAQAFSTFVIGRYNIASGNSTAWIATDPLFVVGNGTPAVPANAVTVLKDGKVGIGTSTPSSALTVAGNIAASGTICGANGCLGNLESTSAAGRVDDLNEFGIGTFDVFIETGFRPQKITLHYYLQGRDSQNFSYTQTTGIAVFNETAVAFNHIIGDSIGGAGDDGPPNQLSQYPSATWLPFSGSPNAPGKRAQVSILEVTDTGFTVRRTLQGDTNFRGRIKVGWEANS